MSLGNYSDLRGRKELGAGDERVKALKAPCAKETGQDTFCHTAARQTGTTADLSAHSQRTHGSFSSIVVKRRAEAAHKVKGLLDEPLTALTRKSVAGINA